MNKVIGAFHMEEVDGKPYFVYHQDSPGGESTTFLCPEARRRQSKNRYTFSNEKKWDGSIVMEIDCSPYFNGVITKKDYYSNDFCKRLDSKNHLLLPLFWCKNKEKSCYDGLYCSECVSSSCDSTNYYVCVKCDSKYHKECAMSPSKIKTPLHPSHPLKLFKLSISVVCTQCGNDSCFIYHCAQCNLSMHPLCAFKPIPILIDQPKRHDHPLTFFTRKTSLDCNVCGLIKHTHSTYVCVKCDFVAHQDCADFPSVIKISRHHHRVSFTSSLSTGNWSCGVCRKNVNNEYGSYTCKKCDGYVVHSRCALRKDIWDGNELENILEENDIEEVVDPFERISDGIILHFSHNHYLKLETIHGEVYDENKICHACVIPIYDGDFYSCMECDFILHDTCANSPRKIHHPLHPHPFILKATCEYDFGNYFNCHACGRLSCGFVYESHVRENLVELDMRCASISEPFDYAGHEHSLFLALDPQEKQSCQFCHKDDKILINCIECEFIRCLECVTLPYMAKYKHDKHFIQLSYWEDANEQDWCEICERLIFSKDKKERRFYRCKECCTNLHLKCLFGEFPYLKPGHTSITLGKKIQFLPNNSQSRPICYRCHNRCKDKLLYKEHDNTYCSLLHVFRM